MVGTRSGEEPAASCASLWKTSEMVQLRCCTTIPAAVLARFDSIATSFNASRSSENVVGAVLATVSVFGPIP